MKNSVFASCTDTGIASLPIKRGATGSGDMFRLTASHLRDHNGACWSAGEVYVPARGRRLIEGVAASKTLSVIPAPVIM